MKPTTILLVAGLALSAGFEPVAFAHAVDGPSVSQESDAPAPDSAVNRSAPPSSLHQQPLSNEMPQLLPRSNVAKAVEAYKEAIAELKRSLDVELRADPDTDYVRLLIAQYEGMIALGSVVLDYGTDPNVREAAEFAINTATQELATLRGQQAKPKP